MLRKHDEWLTGTNGGRGKVTVKAEEYLLGSHGRYIREIQVCTYMCTGQTNGEGIGRSAPLPWWHLLLGDLVRQPFWLPVTSV